VNHTRFPKEDHLPYWARWDNKVTKGDRVEYKCTIFPEDGTLVPKHAGNASLVFVLIKTVQLVGVIKRCDLIAGYIVSE